MSLGEMNDDEDYMSDKFLNSIADVRPSLIHQRCNKRKLQIEHKKNELIKQQKQQNVIQSGMVDKKQLEEDLKKPLNADNKGFQMLAKMGYKAGDGLGKSNKDKSLLEPITLTVKSDRRGLGGETALKELAMKHEQIQLRNAELTQETAEQYRKRAIAKAEQKSISNHLRRCQITCENLDRKSHVTTPKIPYMWLEPSSHDDDHETDDSNSNDSSEEETSTDAEKLDVLLAYLRSTYYFCYWCGIAYNDIKDLEDNCPGQNKDDH